MSSEKQRAVVNDKEWVQIVKKYQKPDNWRASWQLINSVVPFFVLWYLAYRSLEISYWLTIGLTILNIGFATRIFIIQHDCGHNSFYPSLKLNNLVGILISVINLTPYYHWRKLHAIHHATSGDLDFRGIGDIDTVTVNEYLEMPKIEKLKYRFFRNPFVTFLIGPPFVFVFRHRYPYDTTPKDKKERRSVWLTNLALAIIIVVMGNLIGYKEFFMVQVPLTYFTTIAGVWLFYVQHQFEDTYWRWHPEWDYKRAALEGSSYFKLPKVFQWLTGNIGFHHVHHLSPAIPNYLLEEAHNNEEIFQNVETLTFFTAFRTMFLDLWDEESQKLISFWQLKKMIKAKAAA